MGAEIIVSERPDGQRRITIPVRLAKFFDINGGDVLEFSEAAEPQTLKLRKVRDAGDR